MLPQHRAFLWRGFLHRENSGVPIEQASLAAFPSPPVLAVLTVSNLFPSSSDSLKGDNSTQMAGDTAGGTTLALAGLANDLGSEL